MPGADVARRFEWLYTRANPEGAAHAVIAFAPGGEPAGMTSIFPRRFVVDGDPVRGGLGGDGWVRPQFRRRGIASFMHMAARMVLPAEGMELMFGTPLRANRSPVAAAGARDVEEVPRFVRPAASRRPRLANWLLKRIPRGRVLPLDPSPAGDPRLDALWDRVAPEVAVGVVRDAKFYTSRFHLSPAGVQQAFVVLDGGRAVGACALEHSPGRFRIVDLVSTASDFGRVLRAIVACADDRAQIEVSMTREEGRRRALWAHGFVAREALPLNVMPAEGTPYQATLFEGSCWTFSWADTDLDDTARRERNRPGTEVPAERVGEGS